MLFNSFEFLVFLPLVLLVVPNCALQTGGLPSDNVLDPGPGPLTSAIMCDIPKVPDPGSDGCATSIETGLGMSDAHAAVALAQGEQSSIALDLSAAAEAACFGFPKKVEYRGPFPDGYAVCLNCGAQIPAHYADANAVCVAQCIDLVNQEDGPEPPGGAEAFCQANAHVSTNFDKNSCFDNACSGGGTLRPDFVDPRRAQEPVKWTDLIGTSASGNSLTRTAPTNGIADAGAASEQTITHGDAWVEFEAGENDAGHFIGLSLDVGKDLDPSQADIAFGIRLGETSRDGDRTEEVGVPQRIFHETVRAADRDHRDPPEGLRCPPAAPHAAPPEKQSASEDEEPDDAVLRSDVQRQIVGMGRRHGGQRSGQVRGDAEKRRCERPVSLARQRGREEQAPRSFPQGEAFGERRTAHLESGAGRHCVGQPRPEGNRPRQSRRQEPCPGTRAPARNRPEAWRDCPGEDADHDPRERCRNNGGGDDRDAAPGEDRTPPLVA